MKSSIIKIIISLAFLALFNALFFILGGTKHTDIEWVSYGFIHAAYLMVLLTPLFCLGNPQGVSVQSGSLYLRATFYFFTELIVGAVFLIAKSEEMTWPLIAQSVLFAVFIVLQLASVLANDATNDSIKKQQNESLQIQTMVLRLRTAFKAVTDEKVRSQVKRCIDAVECSPLESFPEVADAEVAVQSAVDALCFDIESEVSAETILNDTKNVLLAVSKRNAAISLRRRYK